MSALTAAPPVAFVRYASFWQRFAAAWVDFFVVLPVILLLQWSGGGSRDAAMVVVLPIASLYLAYSIYGHGKFGCTVGKYVMHIRVVRVDGVRIGWPEAWKRSAVDVALSLFEVAGSFAALAAISEADFAGGASLLGFNIAVEDHHPAWMAWLTIATHVWIWSEVIVMLFNERRRALHDFIAGTIVVSLK